MDETDIINSIKIDIQSNRLKFVLEIQNKVTIILGDSGKGKTTLISIIDDAILATKKEVSSGCLMENLNRTWYNNRVNACLKALKRENPDLNITKLRNSKIKKERMLYQQLLSDYWKSHAISTDDGVKIYFVDDANFVKDIEFTTMFNADTDNYYVLMIRGPVHHISYSVDAVYKFVISDDGFTHTIEHCQYSVNENEEFNSIIVKGSGSDLEFFKSTLEAEKIISAGGQKKCCKHFKTKFC